MYCTGRPDAEAFDAKIDFDINLIPYEGDDGWVEDAILELHTCLNQDEIPGPAAGCDYCKYIAAVNEISG